MYRYRFLFLVCLLAAWSTGSHAGGQTVTYDASTRYLTVPSIPIGNVTFSDLVVRLDAISLVSVGATSTSAARSESTHVATYDVNTRYLSIPSISVAGTTYSDLVVRLDGVEVISVGGTANGGFADFRFIGGYLPGWHWGNGTWSAAVDDDLLRTANSIGLTVFHIMIPDLEQPLGTYSESELRKLDHFVDSAFNNGVYVIPSFIQGVVIATQTGDPYYNPGGLEGLITTPRLKDAFKSRINTLLSRRNTISGKLYKDDPAILGWIIIEEPLSAPQNYPVRPPNVTPSQVSDWMEEMASYIKSIDTNHLVTFQSPGGIGGALAPNDWLDAFRAPSLDFFMVEDSGLHILNYANQDASNFPLRLLSLNKPLVTMLSFNEVKDLHDPTICKDYARQGPLLTEAIQAYFAAKLQGVYVFPWGSDLYSSVPSYDSCWVYSITNIPIRDGIRNAALQVRNLSSPPQPLPFIRVGGGKLLIAR